MDTEKCGKCKYYYDDESYSGTGYCKLEQDYVRAEDSCGDFEE